MSDFTQRAGPGRRATKRQPFSERQPWRSHCGVGGPEGWPSPSFSLAGWSCLGVALALSSCWGVLCSGWSWALLALRSSFSLNLSLYLSMSLCLSFFLSFSLCLRLSFSLSLAFSPFLSLSLSLCLCLFALARSLSLFFALKLTSASHTRGGPGSPLPR